jgi:hypothetical protein
MSEVVDREGQLVTVVALPALGLDDAGVVDEGVQALDPLGQSAHFVQGGEVGHEALRRAGLGGRRPYLLGVAAVDDHGGPPAGQLRRQAPAQPVGRAGDQDRLLRRRHPLRFTISTIRTTSSTPAAAWAAKATPTPSSRVASRMAANMTEAPKNRTRVQRTVLRDTAADDSRARERPPPRV